MAAALLNADADHSRFIRAIGSTDTVVAERQLMDEIKASGQWSNVAFSNKRAFTHNLTAPERQWFHDNLAVPDPIVLDVTAGGGSIPFEAGRLGLRTIANELNPVAALILRATCQWPQQFGYELVSEYQTVSRRFLDRVRELIEINEVYPPEPAADPVMSNENLRAGTVRLHKYVWAYLWSRTVQCPDCRNLIPLSPNWRLDSKGQGIRLRPDAAAGSCEFEIVDRPQDQSKGTVARGKALCPYPGCGATSAAGYIAAEAQAGRLCQQLYCIIVKNQWQKLVNGQWKDIRRPQDCAHLPNRQFRTPRPDGADNNEADIDALLNANRQRWDADNILPNEPKPPGDDDRPITYGMSPWRYMFSPRQRLAHGYCVRAFRELVDADRNSGELTELRRTAWCYVALALDKLINVNNFLGRWHSNRGVVAGISTVTISG